MGVIRAQITVGHDEEEGAGSPKRAFGRTFKSVLSKDSDQHFNEHRLYMQHLFLPSSCSEMGPIQWNNIQQ
eukprot:12936482-Prorocentrum_lima.AAC.1